MSEPEREEYLGDGLYVTFDGWHYCLRAPRPRDLEVGGMVNHVVYLEDGPGQTLEAFLRFVERMRLWQEMDKIEAEKADSRKRDSEEGFPD
jgi:hypothetical protein